MPRAVHSAILALANLASMLIGFAAYRLTGATNQLAVQVPVAACATVALFAVWMSLAGRFAPRALGVGGAADGWWIYGLATAWAPVFFVPVHFVTQGYLTSFGNVAALWAFQLPVNVAAVPIGMEAVRRYARTGL